MLDRFARQFIDPPLNRMGAVLAQRGVSANGVTLAGLVVGLLGACLIAFGHFGTALWLILLGRICDGLDGAIARQAKPSDFGGYLDIVCDFALYGAVPLAFVVFDPVANGTAGAFLLMSFYVNGASFLGYAILAERNDMQTTAQGVKTLYYSNGLLEGTETILFFVLLCLFPAYFSAMAIVFGALCFLTATMRLWGARQMFNQ